VNPIAEFCRKAGKDQLSGVIFIGFVFVVSLCCLFAQVSVPAIGFTLPQSKLGLALIAADGAFVLFAFLAFWRSHRNLATPEAKGSGPAGVPFDPASPQVRILISGDGEGLSFWKLDGAGELRGWLDIVNFTNAAVKIDRIIGDISVSNTTVAPISFLKKATVAPNSASRIYVHAEFLPQHIKNIEFQMQHNPEPGGGLNLTVYLATDTGEIELHPRLVTGNCRFVNFPRKG
jgi:hypothetical protein